MDSRKICIGWYCPFVYPAITNAPHIDLKQISFGQEQNISFASTKLCRKLSAVKKEITNGALDGIIMVNCCNLAWHMYDLFVKEYEQLPVFLLEIPRKNDESCKKIILRQYVLLEEWLLNLNNTSRFMGNKSISENNYNMLLNNNESLSRIAEQKSDWCCLPYDFNEALPADRMLSNLLKENICPRLISEDYRKCPEGTGNSLLACIGMEPDKFCLIKSYLSAKQVKGEL
ncbi:hypothetical protein [Ruminiclostridium cellobioparum]|uniref:hypothetical protein n=1 Tax=Ruminiclostridium cellobioparum TaxID=29355 RepID=UPI0028AEB965|nr:hypothetical protein [Ruminiclostridium cellobioparum]